MRSAASAVGEREPSRSIVRNPEDRTFVQPGRYVVLALEDLLRHDGLVVVVERERASQEGV